MAKVEDVSKNLNWNSSDKQTATATAEKKKKAAVDEKPNPIDKPNPAQAELMERGEAKKAEKIGAMALGKKKKHMVEKHAV